jgi:hypothetical protein
MVLPLLDVAIVLVAAAATLVATATQARPVRQPVPVRATALRRPAAGPKR